MRNFFLICIALACVSIAAAAKPRLVVKVIVSGMRYDYLRKFEHNFSQKGFMLLQKDGVECSNARYNYSNTTTPAGVMTLLTGANPSIHGIVSDGWMDFTTNNEIGVVRNDKYFGVGCVELLGQYAPTNLIVSTIGDEMKRNETLSRVVSVALTPASTVLSGGINADAAYWFDIYRGKWVTSTYYMEKLPNWLDKYNEEGFADNYKERAWSASLPLTSYLYPTSSAIDNSRRFSLANLFKKKSNENYAQLVSTPVGIDMLSEMAKKALIYESLGKDDKVDMLVITIDPTRTIAESYGTQSMEIEDTYYKLDAAIADLFEYISVQIGKENVLFVLTSDHGSSNTRKSEDKMPGGIFNVMQFKVLMNGFMNAQYGTDNWITGYKNNSLYINRKVAFEKKMNIAELQSNAATFAMQFRGVESAITATSLQNNHFAGGTLSKIQSGYHAKRSGDIVINLMPGWIEDTDEKLSNSGSMYEYDTHVPLMWYGAGLKPQRIDREIDMRNVAPTISAIVGINKPEAATGNEITEITSKNGR